jgi:hypothetical protein
MERLSGAYEDRRSATSDEFRGTIAEWLNRDGELLVLLRLNRAAGRKDWFLIRSLGDLDRVVEGARPSDCLTVFSGHHLPHRRRADANAISAAVSLVSSTEESVFGEIDPDEPQLRDAFAAVPGDEEWVEEWIGERPGRAIAFGAYPPFLSEDPKDAVDGIVPTADGLVVVGVY